MQAAPGPVVSQGGDSNTPWNSPGGTHAVGVHNSYTDYDRSMSVFKICRSRAVMEQIAGDQVAGNKRKSVMELSVTEPNKHFLRNGFSYSH